MQRLGLTISGYSGLLSPDGVSPVWPDYAVSSPDGRDDDQDLE